MFSSFYVPKNKLVKKGVVGTNVKSYIYEVLVMNRINYIYSLIPITTLSDNRLTSLEKLLLFHIVSLCKQKDYCWATNKYFCDIYNVSRQTVSKSINNLSKSNYLKSDYTRTNINSSKRKIALSDDFKDQIKSIKDNFNTSIQI